MNCIEHALTFAEQLADLAGSIAKGYFRSQLPIQTKHDTWSTMVTKADQEIENALVAKIRDHFPDHGVIREEFENINSKSGYNWVIDPIDGTSSFVAGRPIWGTLIALVNPDQTPILGILDQPVLKERWIGIHGQETCLNGAPVQTNSAGQLGDAILLSTTPAMFQHPTQEATLKGLEKACGGKTVWGGDCYSYGALASNFGAPMVILETDLQFYDFAALVPIIKGAGGEISNWLGQPLTLNDSQVLASSNPALHSQCVALVKEAVADR